MSVKLSERDVTAAVKGWLEAKGWLGFRLQSGLVRGWTQGTPIRLNKKGTPDWLFVRKWAGYPIHLFVEMKAPGKQRELDQLEWFEMANRHGLWVIWADSLEMFIEKYEQFWKGLR